MKKFIIVLALVMMLFALPNRPSTEAPKSPQTAIVEGSERVPDEIKTSTETAIYGEISEVESTAAELIKEALIIPEKQSSEHAEIAEESTVTEMKETVECLDEGNQSLTEYRPQVGNQPNPFENDIPTEIDDRPVVNFIDEGEDRPGEGIHF